MKTPPATKPVPHGAARQRAEPPPRSAVARAELLCGLWLAKSHGRPEAGLALAAGYEKRPQSAQSAQTDAGQRGGASQDVALVAALAGQNPETPESPGHDAAQARPALRACFWALTGRVALDAPAGADTEEHADGPLAIEDLLGAPDAAGPPWQAILPLARLMPALKRNLQTERGGGLDLAKLIDTIAHGKPLRHLPRRKLTGWTEKLLLVLDFSEPLLPYRRDMQALACDLRRWIGPANTSVRLVCAERDPLGPWLEWSGNDDGDADDDDAASACTGWQGVAADTKIMLVSEMGLTVNDGGHATRAWAAWLAVLGAQGARTQVWCPLPIGPGRGPDPDLATGVESHAPPWQGAAALPRFALVHWSAASRLRPTPLPTEDMHRTPVRLELARQIRVRLARLAWVDPGLLRALRLGMGAQAIDAGLEQLVWDHPDMTRHHAARALKSACRPAYEKAFDDLDSAQKCALLDTLLEYDMAHNPLLAHRETLVWAANATAEQRAARQDKIALADSVTRRFARNPWQFEQLERTRVDEFIDGYVRGVDQRTREFCSPAMSRLWAALHRQRHGELPLGESPAGLRAADLASALGQPLAPLPFYLTLDERSGCLTLTREKGRESRLLDQRAIPVRALSIRVGLQTPRWIADLSAREIRLARVAWGERVEIGLAEDPWPVLAQGPICLDTGAECLTITALRRPSWALGSARERDGVVALVPNPWGAPLRVSYPRAEPASAQVLWQGATGAGKGGLPGVGMTLELDELGLLARLTLDGGHGQVFRHIAAGRFLMGSAASEAGRSGDEGPQHMVTIGAGYWLADTACTQGFWQAVMGDNPSYFNAGKGGGPSHPVEQVSWNMAQEFLKKLQSLLPGCRATLPTEAEWEYACRAGSGTPFSFGATITTDQVNYAGDAYGDGTAGKYRGCTVAVKDLPPNCWGLYQMHGNVWEWCADRVREYGAEAVADPGLDDALAPLLGGNAARVLRGGGWINGARDARSAFRDQDGPDGLLRHTGLRLALRSEPSQ